MNLTNEIYNKEGVVSSQFLTLGIHSIEEAYNWVAKLPYRRNSDKNDALIVLKEACGTCSSKHALLKRLADENGLHAIRLMLGIFKMNGQNNPAIKKTLAQYNLDYIPEAHNYLKVDQHIMDFTGLPIYEEDFSQSLLTEIEINPEQITTYKTDFHKRFLKQWIIDNKIPYSLDELWQIREKCIYNLSKANLQLVTERLLLRPFDEEDAQDMYNLNADPEVLQYTGDIQFENLDTARAFLAAYPQYERYHLGRLLLIERSTQEVLGWCGLKYDEECKEYDIGYRLFKKHWANGYATEAAQACIDYGFHILGISSIIGRSRIENKASIHVLEKLNMKFEKQYMEDKNTWRLYRINRIDYL